MTEKVQLKSRNVMCLSTRMWSLLIGWFQVVGSFLAFVFGALVYFSLEEELELPKNDFLVIAFVLGVLALFTHFFAGMLLIKGVKQQNHEKLKFWTAIQIALLIFTLGGSLLSGLSSDLIGVSRSIFEIFVAVVCLTLVDMHMQELETNCLLNEDPDSKDFQKV